MDCVLFGVAGVVAVEETRLCDLFLIVGGGRARHCLGSQSACSRWIGHSQALLEDGKFMLSQGFFTELATSFPKPWFFRAAPLVFL